MMSASFGREIADSHFRQLFEEAEHDRLVGCLRQQRRAHSTDTHKIKARRRVTDPCPQDVG